MPAAKTKAVRIHRFGDVDVLQLDELPVPVPAPDEVLIRVHAASLNPVDAKMRGGHFAALKREDLPFTLGRDVSGVIERCGESVGYFKPCDAVIALLDHTRGGHAQLVAAKSEWCTLKPANIDHREAAALPLAALTAYQALFDHAQLKPEQRVLIHGGAGGVGHVAVQLAKAKGARVCTTVGPEDLEFASELGADEALDHQSQRFEDVFEAVDVVLDLIGGETQDRSWKLLKNRGALVSTVSRPDEERARVCEARAALITTRPNGAQLAEIARLVDTGELVPRIAETFPLARVAEAHRALEQRHARGKVVLIVAET